MNYQGRVSPGTAQGDPSPIETPTLSIVIPAFNEAEGLSHLYQHLGSSLSETAVSWEVLFVDDGSKDKTWNEICRLCEADGRVRGLRLSRNFGHQSALLAGLAHARGDAVISMDADMQHPPELIPALVDAWQKGAKIVKTVRIDPEDLSWFKRVTSNGYYRLFSFLSGVEIKEGMADFRLMDRQVLDNLLQFKEEGLFLRGMVQWMGYPSVEIPFECGPRFAGTTKYSLRKMLRLAWHGVSSFSLVPLRVAIMTGLVS
ncbi:MAG: glycosyltransferase family 2 protein, partial [Methylococcaceae bacterium]|nr:glycosyltransferase family 2 protein [Methylococcaceae bacterium]